MEEKETLYARWLSGEITQEELQNLERSGELEELETIIQATNDFALPTLDKEKKFAAIRNRKQQGNIRTLKPRKFPIWAYGVAAAVVLSIGLYVVLSSQPTSINAKNAQNSTYAFLDNSSVILNDGSTVKFDEKSWPEKRKVDLKGEAFFEVTKGNTFEVHSTNGVVTVLGTSFNVRAWGDKLYVECYEGRVRVDHEGEALEVPAGFALNVVNKKMGQLLPIKHQNPLWLNGESRFYDEPLNIVFEEFERQFDVKVNFKPSSIKFFGAFSHTNPDSALVNICEPENLDYIWDENKQVVTIVTPE